MCKGVCVYVWWWGERGGGAEDIVGALSECGERMMGRADTLVRAHSMLGSGGWQPVHLRITAVALEQVDIGTGPTKSAF